MKALDECPNCDNMPCDCVMSEGPAAAAKEKAVGPSDAASGSRFPAARVEELMQARDNLAEGDGISHGDACDLVNWYADELDRVRIAYQSRIMDISIRCMEAAKYPENS